MLKKKLITVEVAFALSDKQLIIKIIIPEGANIKAAIDASNILLRFPEIDLNINKVGVFDKISDLNTLLRHQDRVEIYRPLMIDPKEARVKRAQNTQDLNKI